MTTPPPPRPRPRPGELTRFRNAEPARQRYGAALVQRLEQAFWETDTLADEAVACFTRLPGGAGRAMLEVALAEGIQAVPDAPAPLTALIEQVTAVPDWVDWEQLDAGAIAYLRPGIWMGLALGCASLAAGYRSGAGVKPLVRTGRLIDMAGTRLRETGSWILAAASPGGMRPGRPGFTATVRIRLVHAMVRRRLMKAADWQWSDWGAPINHADTAHGITGEFSSVMINAVTDAGIHYTPAEREAIYHLWRYIGHVLGAPTDLLPTSQAHALTIVGALDLTESPADQDSRLLVHSLIRDGLVPALPLPPRLHRHLTPTLTTILYGLTRRWAGPDIADQLHLPTTHWHLLIPLLRPAVQTSELLRRSKLRSGTKLATRHYTLLKHQLTPPDSPTTTPINPAHIPTTALTANTD